MTDRDFDQDDARELAEFAELEKNGSIDANGNFMVDNPHPDKGISITFIPWSAEAPQWQLYRLLDAVREKGLEEEFSKELNKILFGKPKHTMNLLGKKAGSHAMFDVVSAPPEAICSAILSLEVE